MFIISLEEILLWACSFVSDSFAQMVLSAFESCSKVLIREGTAKVESRHWSYNEEAGGSLREMVPDGACYFMSLS